MKHILPRSVYSSVVGVVIVTTSVNPASGGWLLNQMRGRGAGHCQVVNPCEPVCCETPVLADPCCGSMLGSTPMMHEAMPVGSGCCGSASSYGGETVQDGMSQGHEGKESPAPGNAGPSEMWQAPGMNAPATSAPSDDSRETSSSDITQPAPRMTPNAGQPAPQTLAPTPSTGPAPPANNLFDEPAAPGPAAQPAAPAAEPALDDLFGEAPAAPATPAAPTTPEPATPAAPVTPAAPANDAPAADLFGEPASPAPAADAPMDDLFGEPAAPATPPVTQPAADDIFGTPPAAQPAAPAADPAAPVDPAAPANPAAPAEPAKDSLDDLFGDSPVRIWIDNTGEFSTEGRLIEIGADSIRLLKTNGRTCTVPNSRLCPADVAYVAAAVRGQDNVKLAMLSGR